MDLKDPSWTEQGRTLAKRAADRREEHEEIQKTDYPGLTLLEAAEDVLTMLYEYGFDRDCPVYDNLYRAIENAKENRQCGN